MCASELHSNGTYKINSCSQFGFGPRTAIVVDLTFWSLTVTYELKSSESEVKTLSKTKYNVVGISIM